ncbi:MAG: hypothetical protein RIC35_22140 [Marinoscillum sp.]
MIKFFLEPFLSIDKHCYQHPIVALAEGLRALEIPFIGNIDYWYDLEKMEYLITQDNDRAFDVAVFSHHYATRNDTLKITANLRVVTDLCDGPYGCMDLIGLSKFDLYLKAHYNRNFKYGGNVYPWAFGLTERIINAIDNSGVKEMTFTSTVLDTFRVFHPLRAKLVHMIRDTGLEINGFEDYQPDEDYPSYCAQTGRRHSASYYQTLNSSTFCLAFGGYFSIKPQLPRIAKSIIYRLVDKHNLFIHPALHTITQFDSWRFWESMYSQSIPIHVNLDDWGLVLPVQPQPYVHYVPTAIDKFELVDLSTNQLETLSHNSKNFAYENYAPIPTARRFLNLIESL